MWKANNSIGVAVLTLLIVWNARFMSPVKKATESPDSRTLVRLVFGADITLTVVEVEPYELNMSIALAFRVTLPPLSSAPAGRTEVVYALKLAVASVMFEPNLFKEYEKE